LPELLVPPDALHDDETPMGSEEDDDEPVLKEEPPAPISVLRRVMISRNAGRMTGSTFQQLTMRASNSAGAPWSSGMVGRRLSLITATATAAGLLTHITRTARR
jgi:hypothetical protein